MFDLDKHILKLLNDEPFFAALSRGLVKVPSTDLPTAGVRLNVERARYELYYNPDFMQEMFDRDPNFVKGILMHEFYHIVLFHVCRRLPEGKMSKAWNVATDLAINCNLISYGHYRSDNGDMEVTSSLLPLDKGLFPGLGKFKQYAPHLHAEAYLKMLEEDEQFQKGDDQPGQGEPSEGQPGQGEPGDGEGEGDEKGEGEGKGSGGLPDTLDDHEGWGNKSQPGDGEGSEATSKPEQQIAEQQLKELTRKAANEANVKGYGTVSASIRETIKKSLKTSVNWRSILRSFVKASQRSNKTSTIKRLNRRYAYIHPGRKIARQSKIAVSIDQSGSVSNTMLAAFYAELDKLAAIADFTVVPFDSEVSVKDVFVWKKGERREYKRYMCGGTDFNAPTNFVNEGKFDGHIILTDMYAPKPVNSNCQRMWMTDRGGAECPYFKTTERVIIIEE